MIEIIANEGQDLDLGKRGENLARRVTFDIGGWVKTFGEGEVHLLHQRNGDKAPYPCVVEVEKTNAYWSVTNTDVATAGRGHAELQYWVGDSIVKSVTFNTRVSQSMGVAGEVPPAPAENWLNTMLGLGTETKENAEAAAESAESAQACALSAKESAAIVTDGVNEIHGLVDEAIADALDSISASVGKAEEFADTATQSAESAATESEAAKASADAAEEAKAAAESAQAAAESAQTAAEEARDEAEKIAGGNFLPLEGGKLTGHLMMQPDGVEGYGRIMKNANSENDYGLKLQDIDADENYIALTLSASLQALEYEKRPAGDSEPHYAKIYDSDDPPTAEEVGALPITGGKLTSNLYIEEDYAQVNVQTDGNHKATLMKNADSANDYGTILRDTNGDDVAELKLNAAEKSLKYAQDGKEYRLYHQGNTHASQHSASGSDPITPPMIGAASNPNLLDNWYFADPIDQRGGYVVPPGKTVYTDTALTTTTATPTTAYRTVEIMGDYARFWWATDNAYYYVKTSDCVRGYQFSTTSGSYGFDRWKSLTGAVVVLLEDDGMRIVANNNQTATLRYVQYIENPERYYGKTVTISVLYKGAMRVSYNGDQTLSSHESSPDNYGLYTKTFVVPNNFFCIGVHLSNGYSTRVKAMKLELGSTQTLAHQENGNWVLNDPPPNKQQELAKCQRYQIIGNMVGPYVRYLNDYIGVFVPTPVTLRATPSLIGTWTIMDKTSAEIADFAVSTVMVRKNGVYISLKKTAHGLDGGYISFGSDGGLDANL